MGRRYSDPLGVVRSIVADGTRKEVVIYELWLWYLN
jgi:hypothetical protein